MCRCPKYGNCEWQQRNKAFICDAKIVSIIVVIVNTDVNMIINVLLFIIKSFIIIVLLYLSLTIAIIMIIMAMHHNATLLLIRTLYHIIVSIMALFLFFVYGIALEYGSKHPKRRKIEPNKNTSLQRLDAAQVKEHTSLISNTKLPSFIESLSDAPSYSRHPNFTAYVYYHITLIEIVIIVILTLFLLLFYRIDSLCLIMDNNMINMIYVLFVGHLIMITNDNSDIITAKYLLMLIVLQCLCVILIDCGVNLKKMKFFFVFGNNNNSKTATAAHNAAQITLDTALTYFTKLMTVSVTAKDAASTHTPVKYIAWMHHCIRLIEHHIGVCIKDTFANTNNNNNSKSANNCSNVHCAMPHIKNGILYYNIISNY